MCRMFYLLISGFIFLSISCSKKSDSSSGGASGPDSSVSGRLPTLSISSLKPGEIGAMTAKTITHIMAVSPSTANATRYVSSIGADGSFQLSIDSGKPWLIVFVAQDGVLMGPDMIAGIIRVAANGLDTLPLAQAGTVALGDVTVDGSTSTATPSTLVSDLLTTLGVTSAEASFIGGVDDLALRLANPDIDGNGVIDATEDKNFMLDWHVRATTKLSSSDLLISDVENTFADPANLSLTWTLGSAYATYMQSFDNVQYPVNPGVDTTLQNGGEFLSTGTVVAPTSYSGGTYASGTFSDWRTFGADYNMTTQELGASDLSSTFTYTLGSPSKKLTFSNIRTRTKASLNSDGTVLPFVKVNTLNGKITGIDYKWMKKTSSTWEPATTAEVGLIVQSSGAYISLNTWKVGSSAKGMGFNIPSTSATGTVNINGEGFSSNELPDPTNVAIEEVCSSALSYDDKMGLRLFAGGFGPKAGTTACP